MAKFSLRDFTDSLAASATGYLQGQQAGQQALMEQQRQQRAEALQAMEFARQQQEQQRQQAMAPYSAALQHISLLSPDSQAKLLGGVSAAAGQPPAAGTLDSIAKLYPPGSPAAQALSSLKPPTTPTAPAAPPPMGKLGEPMPPPPVTTTAAATTAAPGTETTTAKKPKPSFTAGGLTLDVGAGVDKATKADFLRQYREIGQDIAALPDTNPQKAKAMELYGAITNLAPETDEDAQALRQSLAQVRFVTPHNFVGHAGEGLDALSKAFAAKVDTIPDMAPEDRVQALFDLNHDRKAIQDQAKAAGRTVVLSPFLAGNQKELDQLEADYNSGDPEKQKAAIERVNFLASGITHHLTGPQITARMQRVFQYASKLSQFDPDYEKKVNRFIQSSGMSFAFPNGAAGMAGGAQEKVWQEWLGRLNGAAGLAPKSQRLILDEGRAILRAMGRDPDSIPDQIARQMTPEQQKALKDLGHYDEDRQKKDRQFNQTMEKGRLEIDRLKRQATTGNAGTIAQQRNTYLRGLAQAYGQAKDKVDRYYQQYKFRPEDLVPGPDNFLDESKPGLRHEVAQAVKDMEDLQQKALKYVNSLKPGAAPAAPAPTTKKPAAQAAPAQKAGAPLTPQQMRSLSTAQLQARLRTLRGAP